VNIPIEKWYSAIFERHSRRQFDGRTLPNELLNNLMNFTHELNDHIHGVRAVVVNQNPEMVFKGAIGSYGKIKGAPAYVAFIGNMKDSNVQEKVGLLGEFFILEATSMGLATCWVGGFFRPDVVQTHIQLNGEEQVLAVSPLGFANEQITFEEKIMSGFATSHKRKDLDSLFSAQPTNPLPQWIRSALEAARIAPSAVNRQPWRFTIENDTIKVSVDNSRNSYHISKRLDCGIAMAHIIIGANHERVKGQWEYLTNLDVARFKRLE
jgi:nitroreductase